MVILLPYLFLACQPEEEPIEPLPLMEDSQVLLRTSMDLRGIRPSVEDYERLESEPAALDDLVEGFLNDARFGHRVAELYSETLLTRTETYYVNADAYGADITQAEFIDSIGNEVVEMVAHVSDTDRPWTDMVTGDWTMANETLAKIWPVTYPEGETGWHLSQYTDDRPGAGALSANSMWWRYTSTPSNANRKRANAVSRIFLCNDFLQRNIDFDRNINLLDQASVDDALKTNPACISCHVSLDPLAGYFYGFWHYTTGSVIDVTYYHPEREMQWKNYSGVAPGYFGTPSYTLKDLGNQIASDNRTVECAVETVWSGLLRRPVEVNDMSELALHREAFLEGDLTMRSLVRSIVNSPVYRSGLTDDPGAVPLKMVTPDLLASQIEDLTGFRWTFNGFDVLRSDTNGYLTLAGGADGYFVTEHATHPNATLLLVQERLAEAAASYVVTQDQMNPGNPTLFHEIDFTETPETDQAAMTRQLQALHFRLFGTRIASDGEEVVANLELWSDLYEIERSTTGAWTGLLSALLREPALLFY